MVIIEGIRTYKRFLAFIGGRMVVQAVDCGFDGICRRLEVAVYLLNLLVSVQAFGPAHLVLIYHLQSAISAIPIYERVYYRNFTHALCLNSHGHHVASTGLIEANVDNCFTPLFKKFDSSAQQVVLNGGIRLVILSLQLCCQT